MSDAAAAASSDTMQALLLHSYAKATADAEQKGAYRVEAVPKPQIKEPLDILVQVHAASINPIDWKIAQGDLKLLLQETFPAKLGYDLSGVVVSIGAGVSKFAVGDEVISRVSATQKGTFAEFAVTSEDITVKKPANLSHVEASCIPLAGLTALQCIKLSSVADKPAPRSAFLPAALGGVGSMAIQIARHHFHLEKIVTAVSTNKVAQTQQLLGGDDLDIVDYKTTNVAEKYRGQLDFVLDNTGEAATYMPMLKPTPAAAQIAADRKARGEAMSQGADAPSRIVSIATAPDGEQAAGFGGSVPWLVKQVLNFKDWRLRSAAKSAGGQYSYLLLHENAPELQILADLATAGHLKPVVGKVFPLREARKAMEASADNAVTGKVVIQMPVDAPAAGVAVGAAAPAAEEEKSAQ